MIELLSSRWRAVIDGDTAIRVPMFVDGGPRIYPRLRLARTQLKSLTALITCGFTSGGCETLRAGGLLPRAEMTDTRHEVLGPGKGDGVDG